MFLLRKTKPPRRRERIKRLRIRLIWLVNQKKRRMRLIAAKSKKIKVIKKTSKIHTTQKMKSMTRRQKMKWIMTKKRMSMGITMTSTVTWFSNP